MPSGSESIVEIKGHKYRYRYNPDTQKMEYLGPVGDAPALLSEEQFQEMVEAMRGSVISKQVMDDILEGIKTYAVIHKENFQDPYGASSMHWRSSSHSGEDIVEVIKNVIPPGKTYNAFNSDDVRKFISSGRNVELDYQFGREYSPVLYIKGFKNQNEMEKFIISAKNSLNVDEVYFTVDETRVDLMPVKTLQLRELNEFTEYGIETGTLRIWWD